MQGSKYIPALFIHGVLHGVRERRKKKGILQKGSTFHLFQVCLQLSLSLRQESRVLLVLNNLLDVTVNK